MPYDHFEHRHKFAAWAAARASHRGVLNGGATNLTTALKNAGVKAYLARYEVLDESLKEISAGDFDLMHSHWCERIRIELTAMSVASSYGKIAKLVAIYLKAMIVNGPEHSSPLAQVAHPPIDEYLLIALHDSPEIESAHKQNWAEIKWSKLDDKAYYELIAQLRELPQATPFWMIEEYWPEYRDR